MFENGYVTISNMQPLTPTIWQHLAPSPSSCYRQLFLKGTRIRARVVYGHYMSADEPMTPEQIAAEFNVPLVAVNEAIAYCQINPPEIALDMEREEKLGSASGINDPDYRYGGRFKVVASEEIVRILQS